MSIVRDVSVSCAELKLVTVRVARPRHRSTVEEPGLRAGAEVDCRCGISRKKRAAEFAKLEGSTRVRGRGPRWPLGCKAVHKATCLAQALTLASSLSPLGLSQLLTLINDN